MPFQIGHTINLGRKKSKKTKKKIKDSVEKYWDKVNKALKEYEIYVQNKRRVNQKTR